MPLYVNALAQYFKSFFLRFRITSCACLKMIWPELERLPIFICESQQSVRCMSRRACVRTNQFRKSQQVHSSCLSYFLNLSLFLSSKLLRSFFSPVFFNCFCSFHPVSFCLNYVSFVFVLAGFVLFCCFWNSGSQFLSNCKKRAWFFL